MLIAIVEYYDVMYNIQTTAGKIIQILYQSQL